MPLTFDEWFWKQYVMDGLPTKDIEDIARAAWNARDIELTDAASKIVDRIRKSRHHIDGDNSPRGAYQMGVDDAIEEINNVLGTKVTA